MLPVFYPIRLCWSEVGDIALFCGLVLMGPPQCLAFLCIFIINHVGCSTSTLIFWVRIVCEE